MINKSCEPHLNMKNGNEAIFKRGRTVRPQPGPESDLVDKIRRLQADRAEHAQAIDEIDKVLSRVENALHALKAMTHKTPHISREVGVEGESAPRPRRHYQKFELTGEESVLEFVRNGGNPTTAEINANWQAQGRTGVANPILARLLKRGQLEREQDPTVRGSRYRLSAQAAATASHEQSF
jgi:hypothetical protein